MHTWVQLTCTFYLLKKLKVGFCKETDRSIKIHNNNLEQVDITTLLAFSKITKNKSLTAPMRAKLKHIW